MVNEEWNLSKNPSGERAECKPISGLSKQSKLNQECIDNISSKNEIGGIQIYKKLDCL